MTKVKRLLLIAPVVVAVLVGLAFVLVNFLKVAMINDECFDWKFPRGVEVQRYDPCSSLTLVKIADGREMKANFVLTRPTLNGGRDFFMGKAEEVTVEGGKVMRYLYDGRDNDEGLGNYHTDYSINYDRLPLRSEKSDGRTLLAAEFVMATKNNSHLSDEEVKNFVKLVDDVMAALHTR